MSLSKEYLEQRLEQLKEKKNKEQILELDNDKRKHPAWKQLHGRILEVQYLLRQLKKQKQAEVNKRIFDEAFKKRNKVDELADGRLVETLCQNCRKNKVLVYANQQYFGIICDECRNKNKPYTSTSTNIFMAGTTTSKAKPVTSSKYEKLTGKTQRKIQPIRDK